MTESITRLFVERLMALPRSTDKPAAYYLCLVFGLFSFIYCPIGQLLPEEVTNLVQIPCSHSLFSSSFFIHPYLSAINNQNTLDSTENILLGFVPKINNMSEESIATLEHRRTNSRTALPRRMKF